MIEQPAPHVQPAAARRRAPASDVQIVPDGKRQVSEESGASAGPRTARSARGVVNVAERDRICAGRGENGRGRELLMDTDRLEGETDPPRRTETEPQRCHTCGAVMQAATTKDEGLDDWMPVWRCIRCGAEVPR